MNYFFSIILTLCYVATALRGKRDIFSPRFFVNMFAWLKNVPRFFEIGSHYSDELVYKYFFIKLISWMMLNIGMTFYEKYLSRNCVYQYSDKSMSKGGKKSPACFRVAIFLFIVGVVMKIMVIQRAGGVAYILSHLQIRSKLLSDSGYVQAISNACLNCSVLYIEYYYFQSKKASVKVLFIITTIITAALLLVFGARKPVLMFMLKVLMCYHYCKSKVHLRDLVKPKYLTLIVAVAFFMVMMPMLRYTENATAYMDMGAWIKSAGDSIGGVFKEFSYISGDMFVFDHFNINNWWLGKAYQNILVQWIPSNIYPNKPPMDDGVYLYNMMQGIAVSHNTPMQELPFPTSIPYTLEGSLYMNLGLLGVVLGCFFVGMLYQYVHKVLRDTEYSVYMLLVYQIIITEYVPSVLHTTSPLIGIVFTTIVTVVFFRMRIRRRRSMSY